MTNADQPQDIAARLDNVDTRLDNVDARLDALGDEIDLVRTVQEGMRRSVRFTSQSTARLERTVTELANIARDHQRALRILSQNLERVSQNAERDREIFQAEVRRIWEYLLRQGGNGSNPV